MWTPACRGPRAPVPLAARPRPPVPPREPDAVRSRPGRVRRFVRRYGWRAYAVPLLTIATIAVLIDLALFAPSAQTGAGATGTVGATAPATSMSVPTVESVPTAPAEGDAGPSTVPQVGGRRRPTSRSAPVRCPCRRRVGGLRHRSAAAVHRRGRGRHRASTAPPSPRPSRSTLGDPRSWGNGGRMSFQRVGAAEAAAGRLRLQGQPGQPRAAWRPTAPAWAPAATPPAATATAPSSTWPAGRPRSRTTRATSPPTGSTSSTTRSATCSATATCDCPGAGPARPRHAAADARPRRLRQERLALSLRSRFALPTAARSRPGLL